MGVVDSISIKTVIVLTIIVMFIYSFVDNGKWSFKFLKWPVTTNQDAWMKTKHGDLSAYCDFLKENLFTDDYPDHTLKVPNYKKSDVAFARKLWFPIPSIYLFPTEISVTQGYGFELSRDDYLRLKKNKLLTRRYDKSMSHKYLRYNLVEGLDVDQHRDWAVYIHEGEKYVDVFTLPKGYAESSKRDK